MGGNYLVVLPRELPIAKYTL